MKTFTRHTKEPRLHQIQTRLNNQHSQQLQTFMREMSIPSRADAARQLIIDALDKHFNAGVKA